MGNKGRSKQKGPPSTAAKQIGSCKKFHPDTLTKRLEKRQAVQKHKRQNGFEQVRSLSELVKSAEERQQEFNSTEHTKTDEGLKVKEGIKRSFYKEFRKVVEQADVVLQVLDARDPEGCRCRDAEMAVLSNYTKRLILVINKIDLVPPNIALAWHKHLSKQFPTVLFKANTQVQRTRLKQAPVDVKSANYKMFSSNACLGARELMKLLANYTRNKGIRTSIRVGVIGLPNVGKSSLINSLHRSRACSVGAMPGVTRTIQEVELDKNIKLLDSPGVVLATNVGPLATIQNSVKLDHLEDPVKPIELIMEYCGTEQLAAHYQIDGFSTAQELLALLAFRYGKLAVGGAPDTQTAAKLLLRDWSSGSVQFYTTPPKQDNPPAHVSAAIVTAWSAEFNMDSLEDIRVEDETRCHVEVAAPELSVVFKADKPSAKHVDKVFDKPYEVPQLQHSKVCKAAKRKGKKERKRMDKFSDMFDNTLRMEEEEEEEEEEMTDSLQ